MQEVLHKMRAETMFLENAVNGRSADFAPNDFQMSIQVGRRASQGPNAKTWQWVLAVVGDQSQAHCFGNHRTSARPFLVEQLNCRVYSEAPFANRCRRTTEIPSCELDAETGAPQHHDFETLFNPHLANPMLTGVINQIVSYRRQLLPSTFDQLSAVFFTWARS